MFAIRFINLYKNPSQDYKHSNKELVVLLYLNYSGVKSQFLRLLVVRTA